MDVLSIDFDIIMAPTIEYYNHMVPNRKWEDIHNENPNMIIPKADLNHYNYLLSLLDKITNKNIEIYVAYNHKMILDFLANDTDINIINIDHHHDLSYKFDEAMEKADCSNWARELLEKGKMKKYIWAKNVNSQLPIKPIEEILKPYEYIVMDFNDLKNKMNNIEFQKLFICLSPEWVPPYYQTLFYGLLDFLNQKLNYHLEIHEGS